jgi:hypothetical protein
MDPSVAEAAGLRKRRGVTIVSFRRLAEHCRIVLVGMALLYFFISFSSRRDKEPSSISGTFPHAGRFGRQPRGV